MSSAKLTNLTRAVDALTTPTPPKRIILEVVAGGYNAHIEGNPARWAHGRTAYQAIGDLVVHHGDAFGGIDVIWPGETR